MEVYVIYVMGDYAHAVALATDEGAAEAEADRLLFKGFNIYVEKVKIGDGIVNLLND